MCESRKNTSPYPFGSIPESAQTRDTGHGHGAGRQHGMAQLSNFEFVGGIGWSPWMVHSACRPTDRDSERVIMDSIGWTFGLNWYFKFGPLRLEIFLLTRLCERRKKLLDYYRSGSGGTHAGTDRMSPHGTHAALRPAARRRA
jgi:hypothetical protein